jgi:hypothetical protein
LTVRTMFVTYLVIIVAGLLFFLLAALRQG